METNTSLKITVVKTADYLDIKKKILFFVQLLLFHPRIKSLTDPNNKYIILLMSKYILVYMCCNMFN